MIQSLELHNFQSHKHSKLEFADGVNVIIGGTDTGKTSIMRALRWLIRNRPSGDAFRSTWGGVTEVEIITNDDSIARWKEKTESGYGLDEQEFKAFGTEVPEEIVNALNINEINLQNQLDAPFLLSNSPGEVAQHFNRVAHLDQIDNGLRKIQQWIRTIEQNINSGEQQITQLEEELVGFAHLNMFEEDVEVLEGMQSQLTTKVHSKHKLAQLIDSLKEVTIKIAQESEIIKAEGALNNILEWIGNRTTKQHERELLNHTIQKVKQITDDLQRQENIIIVEKPVNQLLDLFDHRAEKEGNLKRLQRVINNINGAANKQGEAQVQLDSDIELFNDMFPDRCPLCGQKVKKS